MKILFDINHPAHVHFFKAPARILESSGAEILFTSRDKDVTTQLLSELGMQHIQLTSSGTGGIISLAKELVQRDFQLYKIAKSFRPDAMAAIGGTFVAHVGTVTSTPSVVFYDTENAKLQNLITYPFSSAVVTPECYSGWVPRNKNIRYRGYHELSYLSDKGFTPCMDIAIENGINPETKNFIIRVVSWNANHDIGENGWSNDLLSKVTQQLSSRGNVIISSERKLPAELKKYAYTGKPSSIHHVMAYSDLYIGESATMASECAVMGVYSLYIALTPRGYTTEQEVKYKMVKNIHSLAWPEIADQIEIALRVPKKQIEKNFKHMMSDTIDVAAFAANTIKNLARTN